MAYDTATGRISAPVSISDMMQATGCFVPDVGNIIVNGVINPWAKYKPVQYNPTSYNKIDTTRQWYYAQNRWKTLAEIQAADINDTPWWWGLSSAKCGIVPKKITTGYASQIIPAYDGDMNGWVYNRPLGNTVSGVQFPFRMTDFAQYNAKALPPVSHFYVPDTITVDQGNRVHASSVVNYSGDYDSVTLADLGINENLYFGVIFEANGTLVMMATDSEPNTGQVDRQLPSSGMLQIGTTYNVYAVLSNVAKAPTNSILSASGEYIYTCPGCPVLRCRAVSHDQSVNVDVDIKPNLTVANRYYIHVINQTDYPFTSLTYVISTSTTEPTSGWTNWPTSQTVAANNSSTILTANVSTPESYLWIKFYWAGGAISTQYTRNYLIEQYTPLPPSPQQ